MKIENNRGAFWSELRTRFKSQMPTRESLESHRWLKPIAHRVTEPQLWHMKTEPLARGVAIGLFWAFVSPIAQMIIAAAHCVWWRGNIPVAVAVTLITNPLTIGAWLYLAYQLGSLFVTGPDSTSALMPASGVFGMLQPFGWPTVLGMALFATGGSLLGYLLVRTGSRLWFHWRVARRARRRLRGAG